MSLLDFFLRSKPPAAEDLDEWARHHDDPRPGAGHQLMIDAMGKALSADELHDLWKQANSLVGKRAPADYGEFMAYGYFEGRREALMFPPRRAREP